MMDVMVIRIVGKEELARIPPQPVATMVVYGFKSRDREQQSRLSDGHERNLFGNGGAKGIKNEAFDWVVVKSAKSIRGIKTMMVGVEVAVEPVICVHGSVPKILPSINHKAMITISKMFDRLEKKCSQCKKHLQSRDTPPVHPTDDCFTISLQYLFPYSSSKHK